MKKHRQKKTSPAHTNAALKECSGKMAMKPIVALIRKACLPAAGLFFALDPVLAIAGPEGGQVTGGQGNISRPDAQTTVVNQQSENLAINWRSFNVNKNELVQFKQPSANATVLNRIQDQKASEIHGSIRANGNVLLVNPNGVFFSRTATVNVNSLTAAGLDIDREDFMQGRHNFKGVEGKEGVVVNQGTIEAATGGSVTLLGKAVSNEGTILATAGQANLVAGKQVTLDFDGDGLMQFAVQEEVIENARSLDAAVKNSGDIIAEGGSVILSGKASRKVFDHTINNEGIIKAGRIENKGGQIKLIAAGHANSLINTGTLNTDGVRGDAGKIEIKSTAVTEVAEDAVISAGSDSGKGGKVRITGNKVGVFDDALVDASAAHGGGQIQIGGGFQGRDPEVDNADYTYVNEAAVIKADARSDGDGGEVIVWADKVTRFYGHVSTTGGSENGDGGFAEISGKKSLDYRGTVDLSAENGQGGEILFDPTNIRFINANTGNEDNNNDGFMRVGSTMNWTQLFSANVVMNDGESIFDVGGTGTLNSVSGNSTITFRAANNITIENKFNIKTATTKDNVNIVLQAGNDININAELIADGSGTVTLTANDNTAPTTTPPSPNTGAITFGSSGSIVSGRGDVTLNVNRGTGTAEATGGITGANITTAGGSITLSNTGTGGITIASLNAGTAVDANSLSNVNITSAGGTVMTQGNIATDAGSGSGSVANAGNVNITNTGGSVTVGANITATGTGNVSLTGMDVTQSTGTVDAGGGTILVDGDGNSDETMNGTRGAISLLGTLTTTSSSATAVRIIDGTNLSLGTVTAMMGTVVLGGDRDTGGDPDKDDHLTGWVRQTGTKIGEVITARVLTGNVGNEVDLGGATTTIANAIGSLDEFTSMGGFTLNDAGGLTVTGDLTDMTGAISLTTAGQLTIGGDIAATGTPDDPDGTPGTPGDVTLESTGLLTINNDITANNDGDVTIESSSGSLMINNNITANGTGNVILRGMGVTQSTGKVDADSGTIEVNGGGSAISLLGTLTTTNDDSMTGAPKAVRIIRGTNLSLGPTTMGTTEGTVTAKNGTVVLSLTGSVMQNSGKLESTGLDVTAGDMINLNRLDADVPVNDFTGNVDLNLTETTGSIAISDKDGLTLRLVALVSSVDMNGNRILPSGSLTAIAGGKLTLPGGGIPLTTGNIVLESRGGTLTTTGNLTGSNVTLVSSELLTINHDITATTPATLGPPPTLEMPGNVILTGTGVRQTADITVSAATTTVNAGTGDINLGRSGNNFTGNVVLMLTEEGRSSSSGTPSITIRDTNNLTLNTVGLVGMMVTDPDNPSMTVRADPSADLTAIAGDRLTLPSGGIPLTTGDIELRSDGGTLTTTGNLTGANVTLVSSGLLDIDHNITATTGTVSLTGANVMQDMSSSVITAGTLTGNATAVVTLGGDNAIGSLGAFGSVGGFTLNDVDNSIDDLDDLTVTGNLTDTTGAISLMTTGELTIGANIDNTGFDLSLTGEDVTQTAGTLSSAGLDVTAEDTIDLNEMGNDFTGMVSLELTEPTGTSIAIRGMNALILSSVTLDMTDPTDPTMTVDPSANLTAIAGDRLTLPSGGIPLTTGDIELRSDGGTLTTTGNLTGANVTLVSSGLLTIDHNITATGTSGTVSLTGTGVTQTADITVRATTTTVNARTGDINLGRSGNDFTGNVVLMLTEEGRSSSLGTPSIDIRDTNDLTLNTVGLVGMMVTDPDNPSMTVRADPSADLTAIAGGRLTLPSGGIPLTTGDIELRSDGGTLTTTGALSGSDVTLVSSELLTINHNITATGTPAIPAIPEMPGNVILRGVGVTQGTSSIIRSGGTTEVFGNAGMIDLNQPGNDFGTLNLDNSGANNNITVADANSLTLGRINSDGAVTIDIDAGTDAGTDGAEMLNMSSATLSAGRGFTFNGRGTGNTGDTLLALNADNTWTIDMSGSSYQSAGDTDTFNFSGFANLTGGNMADTFNISVNHTANINGGDGNDTFDLSGTDVVLTGNINGEGGNDTFRFEDTASLTGNIDGGAGSDTLDTSNYDQDTRLIRIDLGSGTLDGERGHVYGETRILSYNNINIFMDPMNSNLEVGFQGPDMDTRWMIDVNGDGHYTPSGSTEMRIPIGVKSIIGGSGTDTFILVGDIPSSTGSGFLRMIGDTGGTDDRLTVTSNFSVTASNDFAISDIETLTGTARLTARQLTITNATTSVDLDTRIATLRLGGTNGAVTITELDGIDVIGVPESNASGDFTLTAGGNITNSMGNITADNLRLEATGMNAAIGTAAAPINVMLSGTLTALAEDGMGGGTGGIYITEMGAMQVASINAGAGRITLNSMNISVPNDMTVDPNDMTITEMGDMSVSSIVARGRIELRSGGTITDDNDDTTGTGIMVDIEGGVLSIVAGEGIGSASVDTNGDVVAVDALDLRVDSLGLTSTSTSSGATYITNEGDLALNTLGVGANILDVRTRTRTDRTDGTTISVGNITRGTGNITARNLRLEAMGAGAEIGTAAVPINVTLSGTLTALASTGGIYITETDADGMQVARINAGTGSVSLVSSVGNISATGNINARNLTLQAMGAGAAIGARGNHINVELDGTGTLIALASGDGGGIYITETGDMRIGNTTPTPSTSGPGINAGTGEIELESDGTITDATGDDTTVDIEGGALEILSATGIGSASDALNLNVMSLTLGSTDGNTVTEIGGAAYITEADAIDVLEINTSGHFMLTAGGNITNSMGNISAASLRLEATGMDAVIGTTGNHINVELDGTGTLIVLASTGGGGIYITETGDMRIGNTTPTPSTSGPGINAGTGEIELGSNGGTITDATGTDSDIDIEGGALEILSATRIGSASDALYLDVDSLALGMTGTAVGAAYITEANGLALGTLNAGANALDIRAIAGNITRVTTGNPSITAGNLRLEAMGAGAAIGTAATDNTAAAPINVRLSGTLTALASNGTGGIYVTETDDMMIAGTISSDPSVPSVPGIDAGTGDIELTSSGGNISATGNINARNLTLQAMGAGAAIGARGNHINVELDGTGTLIALASGDGGGIYITETGDMRIGNTTPTPSTSGPGINAGTGEIELESDGTITDATGDDTTVDIEGGALKILSATGIGSASDALNLDVVSLTLGTTTTAVGAAYITEANAIDVLEINTSGHFMLTAGNNITNSMGNISAASLRLQATGMNAAIGTTGNHINVELGGTGTLIALASTGSGGIYITETGDMRVGRTTSPTPGPGINAGTGEIELSSDGGSITDATGGDDVDIEGGALEILSATRIGSASDALNLDVVSLALGTTSTAVGAAYITEANEIDVLGINTSGHFMLTAGNNITNSMGNISAASLRLQATGMNAAIGTTGNHINVELDGTGTLIALASTGTGGIYITETGNMRVGRTTSPTPGTSGPGINAGTGSVGLVSSGGNISATGNIIAGNLTLRATDANDDIGTDAAPINVTLTGTLGATTNNGDIYITETDAMRISNINAGTGNMAGNIELASDGTITDDNDDTTMIMVDIQGAGLTIRNATGIGNARDALDLAVDSLTLTSARDAYITGGNAITLNTVNTGTTGNLSVAADEINFGNMNINANQITLSQLTPDIDIAIGGSSDQADVLNITMAEIRRISGNGRNLILGAAGDDITGIARIAGTVNFGNSDITINGASVTFDADTIFTANTTTIRAPIMQDDAHDITFNGNVVLHGTVNTFGTEPHDGWDVGTLTFNRLDDQQPSSLTINGYVLLEAASINYPNTITAGEAGNTGPVSTMAGSTLAIVPMENTPQTIGGTDDGAIPVSPFTGFTGHLIIGGSINKAERGMGSPPTQLEIDINASSINLNQNQNLRTDGPISLLAGDINLAAGIESGGENDSARVQGENSIRIIATAGEASVGAEGVDGNSRIVISSDSTIEIVGSDAIFVAVDNIINAGRASIEMGSMGSTGIITGIFEVAISGGGSVQFGASSEFGTATENSDDFANLLELLPGLSVADVQVINPAADLIGLESIGFIDVGLFEQDLTLFGQIGTGIALSLSQCEEIEGCAPNTTVEELDELIEQLRGRLDELNRRLSSTDDADERAEIEKLLIDYQINLDNFVSYREDLQRYLTADEEDLEFADDFILEDFADTETSGVIRKLVRVLENINERLQWLESLKGSPEDRRRLGDAVGIELTQEVLQEVIDATRSESDFIQEQIRSFQQGTEAMIQPAPLFIAELADNDLIRTIDDYSHQLAAFTPNNMIRYSY